MESDIDEDILIRFLLAVNANTDWLNGKDALSLGQPEAPS